MSTLDVDAVRTFVAIADLKSFTRAAEALGSTQGAISVKLKRLENRLGKKLIERTPRLVRLSAEGAAFLEPARDFLAAHDRAIAGLTPARRRFSLGIATHVGGPEVPTLLSRLNAHDPALTIEVRLNDSRELLDAFDDGKIDAAIILREDDRRDGEVLAPEHFGWFATPGFVHRAGEPLRLAASSPACGILNVARRALDAAGIASTEVFLGCGAFAVADAVSAGLAVSVFSHRLTPPGTVEVSRRFGLPAIPPSEIVLLSTLSEARSRGTLKTRLLRFGSTALPHSRQVSREGGARLRRQSGGKELTVHPGSCHCGGVKFRVTTEIVELTTCDCSLCVKKNAVMTKVPEASLEIVEGSDLLSLYEWNTRWAQHYFCKRCGIYVFHRKRAAPNHFGVNAFCLDGFDLASVSVRPTEDANMTVVDPQARAEWPGPRVSIG